MRSSAITGSIPARPPAVVGATRQAARSGFKDLITFDMGGTRPCLPGQDGARRWRGKRDRRIAGFAHAGARYRVVGRAAARSPGRRRRHAAGRPQSAGADPGPACYGKAAPSLPTDAHVVIGLFAPPRSWAVA